MIFNVPELVIVPINLEPWFKVKLIKPLLLIESVPPVIVPELVIVMPVAELKIPAVDPVIVPVFVFVIVALLPDKYSP